MFLSSFTVLLVEALSSSKLVVRILLVSRNSDAGMFVLVSRGIAGESSGLSEGFIALDGANVPSST